MDMGLEDISDTGLVLGLGLLGGGHGGRYCSSSGRHHDHQKAKRDWKLLRSSPGSPGSFETSLTLGREGDHGYKAVGEKNTAIVARQPSPHSMTSSFSDARPTRSVKRERDVGGEELEVERLSSRASDEDDDGGVKKKLRLTKEQSALLEERFKEHSTLNPKQKATLAKQLNLRPRQVEVWFQNRRARTKLKQTELDCELLRKCCETLSDENRKLQQELQQLKALKAAAPPSIRIPPVALTLCPSCERIGGGATGEKKPTKEGMAATTVFMAGQKPHFLYPFTHSPSAAC